MSPARGRAQSFSSLAACPQRIHHIGASGLKPSDTDKENRMTRRFFWFSRVSAVFLLSASRFGPAAEIRLAISGYDPIAYVTDGKPVPGRSDIDYVWHNKRWRFASPEHRDML